MRLAEPALVERVLTGAGPLVRHLGERAGEALARRGGARGKPAGEAPGRAARP